MVDEQTSSKSLGIAVVAYLFNCRSISPTRILANEIDRVISRRTCLVGADISKRSDQRPTPHLALPVHVRNTLYEQVPCSQFYIVALFPQSPEIGITTYQLL